MIVKYINFLLVCLVGLSINAYSLQLGKIILKSNQNSPLDVSIQVNLSSEDKIDLLKPSIAPKENYDSQGIMRTKIHNDIVLSLIPKNSKQATLRLTSKIPVTEPFLDLLIQVESTSGKILKEYTVLLDPPTNLSPRKKTQEKKIIKSENQGKKNPEKLKKVDSKKIVEKKSNIKASKKKKTVKAIPGKTLFQIARDNPLAGITTEQIVISIYQLNPSAFDGNLNGLIKGKTLRLPLRNYFEKLSHLEARKILKRENISWKKATQKNKPNNNSIKKKKVSNELLKLKKELEIANKKLLEKDQALRAIENRNKPIIEPKKVEIEAPEIISDQIDKPKEPPVVDSSSTFISSITDQNENIIEEVIVDDEKNNDSIKPIFVLVLIFLLTLLLGLLFIVRKRKKEINSGQINTPFSSLSEDLDSNQPNPNEDNSESNLSYDEVSQKNSVGQSSIDDSGISNPSNFTSDSNKDDNPR